MLVLAMVLVCVNQCTVMALVHILLLARVMVLACVMGLAYVMTLACDIMLAKDMVPKAQSQKSTPEGPPRSWGPEGLLK